MHNNIPNKFYFINIFERNNIDKLDANTGVIYRNYNKNLDIEEIISVKNYCAKKKIKFLLSNNFKLALKLDLDGAYIPSFNKSFRHLNYKIKSNFIVIGSAHNYKEIRLKELQEVSVIFISSIFKLNVNYLGINKFMILKKLTKKKVIALGGVSKKNEKKIKLLNCYGFSGISYFE
tara:strand:- start:9029 stop:9556 length:528 start_codon:yes stop_codon:yes gene_type:complete